MIKIGIVGNNNCTAYFNVFEANPDFEFVGIFDPGFQFEPPKGILSKHVFTSFHELLLNSQALVFSSAEKIYLPLIELALRRSKPMFLAGVYNLSLQEQHELITLQDEAIEVAQVSQPICFHDAYLDLKSKVSSPLVLNWSYSNNLESNLFLKTRYLINASIKLIKSNIRKTTVNVFSVCSQLPDVLKVRIDFDNGAVVEIQSDSFNTEATNKLACVDFNRHLTIDFITNKLFGQIDNKLVGKQIEPANNTTEMLLHKELGEFYYCITHFKTPINSLVNELHTQQTVEKIKEKLRISVNIF